MQHDDAKRYILELYTAVLHRTPKAEEFEHWTNAAMAASDPEKLLFKFTNSIEYLEKSKVQSIFPIGHYYSPVVDPTTVEKYLHEQQRLSIGDLPGIVIDMAAMKKYWNNISELVRTTPFAENKDERPNLRFYYDNNIFPYGDAITLRAIIADQQPRKIIEIGSGFSTACMLDSIEEFKLGTTITCIEPYPDRLKSLLTPSDAERVTLIQGGVQTVGLDLFDTLDKNDILFIDSTHVLKTGSDVHFELFHVLPRLASGVLIHFHDIQFPFEYPDKWVLELNHSWNEIYALRLFLMYNPQFLIKFWGNCLAREDRKLIESVQSPFLRNPGGSIWIQRL